MSVESKPTCKTSLVPAVGTNGIADQSAASSQGSRDALGQGVVAESVAETSGGQLVAATTTVPPACYMEQEMSAAVRGQSAAAGVSRGVKGVAARDGPFVVLPGWPGRLVVVTHSLT